MSSHVVKVTGITDELLLLLDRQIKSQHSKGRAEYIRELIRRDLLGPSPRDAQPPHSESLADGTASPKEWSKALRAWGKSSRRKSALLSDEAVSRKSIYGTRG